MGDILREQERGNSANVVFKAAPSRGYGPSISAVVRAGLITIAWPFLLAGVEIFEEGGVAGVRLINKRRR